MAEVKSWEEDKVLMRFINQERKGESHMHSVNGRIFYHEHGKAKWVPRAVYEALKSAVKIEWKMKDGQKDAPPVKYEDPRFYVEIVEDHEKEKKSGILSELVQDKQAKTAGTVKDELV